jgi:ribonuclease BN (tRNA processing enzyme)
MNVKVLGCSGAEFPGHHPPGFLLDGRILFDAGTLNDVLNEMDQAKISDIFITHAHMDHIREIPFLGDNIVIGGWKRKVNIFSIPPVIRDIKDNLLNSRLWPDMTVLPDARHAVLGLKTLQAGRAHRIGEYTVTAYKVNHSVPAVGYLVEDRKERRLFYTGDTGPTESTWKKLGKKQIHCLIIEVSFPNRMEEKAIITGHLTPRLLERELSRMGAAPGRILITHLKPQFYETIQGELRKLRVGNLALLKEGQTIRV